MDDSNEKSAHNFSFQHTQITLKISRKSIYIFVLTSNFLLFYYILNLMTMMNVINIGTFITEGKNITTKLHLSYSI